MADISKIRIPSGTEYDIKDNNAITNITRNGTTFTATKRDGTTFTFTQQDNNTWTALKGATASAAGTAGYVPAPPSDGYNQKYLRADGTWVIPPNTNTDTHYTANLITGASATATANAAATNGNVYLNLYENSSVRNAHNIKGTGATTVTADANGVITINSTNSTYTAANAAPANVATAAVTGSSANYARQDHVHALTKAVVTAALGYTPPTSTDITNAFKANDAMLFKGTLGTGGTVTALPDTHNQGWTYKVITAGTYAGKACEIGDMIICITDGTAANNDHWTVVQTNIDGAVTGPTSSTDAHIAVFNGTSGKVIKDSGIGIATASINGVTAVSTASKGIVSSVATASINSSKGTTTVTTVVTGVTTAAQTVVTGSNATAAAITALNTGTFVTGVTTAAQTVVTGVTTAAQTVVTGTSVANEIMSFTTASIGKTTAVSTASIGKTTAVTTGSAVTGSKSTANAITGLATASIGKTTAVSTGSVNSTTVATTATTVVTGVTTAAQTMVTGVTTAATIVVKKA